MAPSGTAKVMSSAWPSCSNVASETPVAVPSVRGAPGTASLATELGLPLVAMTFHVPAAKVAVTAPPAAANWPARA